MLDPPLPHTASKKMKDLRLPIIHTSQEDRAKQKQNAFPWGNFQSSKLSCFTTFNPEMPLLAPEIEHEAYPSGASVCMRPVSVATAVAVTNDAPSST